jgi:TolA-binding protein
MLRWERIKLCLFVTSLAAASVFTPLGTAGAGDNDTRTSLGQVGINLEVARTLPLSERKAALTEVESALREALNGDLPKDRRGAAHFLSAEVLFERGDYRKALEGFRKAEKSEKKGVFADDAAFVAILALEAMGNDEDAARDWIEWRKKYATSPLIPEAILAQAWNALRRDSLATAVTYLSELERDFPYMLDKPRVVLAAATVDYLEGRAADALGRLTGTGAPVMYLRALCYDADGNMLKAAAEYQRLAEQYPESGLRDIALLANANVFLAMGSYRSAAEEFTRAAELANEPSVRGEAALRRAACTFLDGDPETSADLLREVVSAYSGSNVAARAQLVLGEVLLNEERYDEAIVQFNSVLADYFDESLAASAQYRVGRCLDRLGRRNEATGAYQAVVSGYPLSKEAPAAAYLSGVGLLEQNLPQQAAPYFRLVLDRYAREEGDGRIEFASPEHQELVEAALCLLQLSYYRTGNLGQLSGVPHVMLEKMPASQSEWRAYALLIDADALAAQGYYEESQAVLEGLIEEFPAHAISIRANRLLAWTYAQQGDDALAIETEERMLDTYATHGNPNDLADAYLNKAHILFNRKEYERAAATYDDVVSRYPDHPKKYLALYQAGLCYDRLGRNGDAVDRWEAVVKEQPAGELAERAWVRAGDLYFRTEHYDDAKRCFEGLLTHFDASRAAELGLLRLAQCDYNAGRDEAALEGYSAVLARYPGSDVAREAERGIERALYRLGQKDDGQALLAELVERYPTSAFAADAQFELGMRLYERKEFADAADAFRRVVSQFPDDSQADHAYFLMAEAYTQIGAAREARVACEQFLQFFPESEWRAAVEFRLASLRFDEEDYARAAVGFMAVLENKVTAEIAAASLFNLGLCQRMLGDLTSATATFESYREQYKGKQRRAQVAYRLGELHESEGQLEEAVVEYQAALESGPDQTLRVELYYRIGTCHEGLSNIDSAIRAYKKASASKPKDDAFRLSAVTRLAALHEENGDYGEAILAYRDLSENAQDPEIVTAAKERASQLEATANR